MEENFYGNLHGSIVYSVEKIRIQNISVNFYGNLHGSIVYSVEKIRIQNTRVNLSNSPQKNIHQNRPLEKSPTPLKRSYLEKIAPFIKDCLVTRKKISAEQNRNRLSCKKSFAFRLWFCGFYQRFFFVDVLLSHGDSFVWKEGRNIFFQCQKKLAWENRFQIREA